ncbi:MAG: hypothetical protein P1V20_15085 [Verrucomicrobiales bacterium]|nr:hypothetical protein [Verrucomicrobiales bacterium]
MEAPDNNRKSLVEIALVVSGRDAVETMPANIENQIRNWLEESFPGFAWKINRIDRPQLSGEGAIDPLDLLSVGYREKLRNNCDAAVVLTRSPLDPIANLASRGIVSNALEVAVGRFSTEASEKWYISPFRATLLLLGELWGEEASGGFLSDQNEISEGVEIYTPEQEDRIVDRLDEVADARVEEDPDHCAVPASPLRLLGGALTADPKSLFLDVIRYRPWAQPFRMGRLTAAAGVSTMILILAAESWEVGVNLSSTVLWCLSVMSLLISTGFLVKSQDWGWRTGSNRITYEQEARTALVITLSIASGMTFFGVVLFVVSILTGLMISDETLQGWVSQEIDRAARIRYAVFTAAVGLLAATAGGNLEEERNLKARLLVDKEIP